MLLPTPAFRGWLQSGLILACVLTALFPQTLRAFETVVIDAGHGGKDPGTRWNGLVEKQLCLDVAKRLEGTLKARGFQTVMTRTRDSHVELSERAAISNRHPGAVFVSVHFNASLATEARGFAVHYRSKRARLLATGIQASMKERLPGRSRGIEWEDFKVLRETRGVAVLVECGFLSNRLDAASCKNPDYRQRLAEAIASGLAAMRNKL